MKDIEEELKKAAEKVDVPDMLEPEIMQLRLDARGRRSERETERSEETKASAGPSRVTNEEKGSATDVSEGGKAFRVSGNDRTDSVKAAKAFTDRAEAEKLRKKRRMRGLATAAAAVLLVGLSSWLTYDHFEKTLKKAGTSLEEVAATNAAAEDMTDSKAESTTAAIERHDAGTMYVVAKTDRAYTSYISTQLKEQQSYIADDAIATESVSDAAAADSKDSNAIQESSSGSKASMTDNQSSAMGDSEADYSSTNTVVEGVDEADISKTNGKYIYRVIGESIKVTKADGTALTRCNDINVTNDTIAAVRKTAGTDSTEAASAAAEEAGDTKDSDTEGSGSKEGTAGVTVPKKVADVIESCSVSINEMYVRDGKLIVFGNLYKYGLNPNATAYTDDLATDTYKGVPDLQTKLLTIFMYDLTDPESARLTDVHCIDGYYSSSRITSDGKLVVFANNWVEDENVAWPQIDGEMIGADSIYLPASGLNQSIIATFDPSGKTLEPIDSCMILNNYMSQYVTDDAIFIYGGDTSGNVDATNIARFNLKDGKIDAAGAATVSGTVTNDFAFRLIDDNLFVLTTTYNYNNGDSSNGLYVYDSAMRRRGALTGLAPGETIYSARYVGNMAYFVTYRQTDPLFAVDVSNPDNPQLLGYLKITGFSDYMHPWGDGRLVGLGYETDPKTGEQKGVKLTMFDVSDPANPTVIGTTVIPKKYSDLYTYDHRAVLAFADKNLIGFGYSATDDDYSEWTTSYVFYQWNEETRGFDLLYQTDNTFAGISSLRGLYIGDNLYVSEEDGIEVRGGEKFSY